MSNVIASRLNIQEIAHGLEKGADGIWYTTQSETVCYPQHGHDKCFCVEDRSFWFQHRNACITELIRRWPPPDRGPMLDIGGGNGFVARAIIDSGLDVVLVEPGVAGARNAKRRGLPNVVCATVETAIFGDKTISAAGLFDVIEHIEDDVAFLQSVHRILKPGGKVYVTVPAYEMLWSGHDEAAGHFRRHTRGSISSTLNAASFSVDYVSYFFRFVPFPLFLLRVLPERLKLKKAEAVAEDTVNDLVISNSTVRKLLDWILNAEVQNISLGKIMHFGGSCLVVATKQ